MELDLFQEELRLEEMARDIGVNRFREETRKKVEGRNESGTFYGSALMRRTVEPMAQALKVSMGEALRGKPGRRNIAFTYLQDIPPEVAAFITAKTLIDLLTSNSSLTKCALAVGQAIEDEIRLSQFKKEAPGLFQKVTQQTHKTQDRHKRSVLIYTHNKFVGTWNAWDKTDRLHVGNKLIDIFTSATGLIEVRTVRQGKNKTVTVVYPTEEIVEWIEKSTDNASTLAPAFMPMVIRPNPWTTPFDGGYVGASLRPMDFVKTGNRAYLEEMNMMPEKMAPIYEAVNKIQEVPWRVNSEVLSVMEALWERGQAVAGIPPREEVYIPPFPYPDTPKEDLTEDQKEEVIIWKKEATKMHVLRAKHTGARIRMSRIVSMAQQFNKYEEIFFPHNLDFRGRVYPIPMFLNPQGDDLSKSLLQFAKGKPIGDGTGPGWLAIHGANVWGEDKVSLEDRIQWVEEHQNQIVHCAEDPLGFLWWIEADKPFSFLAFCFEWARYLEEGSAMLTYLPVAMDGSCSGIQHFSAALRDSVGGAAVNLLPSDKPSDVYQEVADLVIRQLKEDASTCGNNSTLAGRLLDLGITRGTTKRATMTLPYGSTKFSCKHFVLEWIEEEGRKLDKKGLISPVQDQEMEAAQYLSALVWDAIGQVVIAARKAMDWLREASSVVSSENLPITWETPDGFPVAQEYRDLSGRRVKTHFGDKLIYLTLQEPKDTLDGRRQANGLPPNWVHSMDATHLRLAVLYGKDNGIDDFAVIHDSFGCHACDTDVLHACLRESLIDLYEGDPLGSFEDQIRQYLSTNANIPERPSFGDLNLNDIRNSDYAFA